jgi:Carbohydrate family 9 binding domain-like
MKVTFILAIVSFLTLTALGLAQTEVSAAKSTVTVDGDLSDWTTDVTVTLDSSMVTDKTDITDDTDYSAQTYLSYDDTNLYIGANVLDDATVFERGGDQLYQTDALEFWLGANQYAVALSEGQAVLHQFSFSGTQCDLSATQVALEYTDAGYAVEVAIPLSVVSAAVGSEVRAGSSFQFAVGGDDTDTTGKAEEEAREGQVYYPSTWEWGKPETYAAVTLTE